MNSVTQNYEKEMLEWRHDFHAHPELNFDLDITSSKVADILKSFGLEVHEGIGKTGIVAVLKNGNSNKSIGIRADMDALPVTEENDCTYKSNHEGKMHACGHDGHTAMALGAAKYLCNTKNFNGTVYFIFQPDEEKTQGAQAMIDDGLFEKFPMDEGYAFHNLPGMELGTFATRAGTITASESLFKIELRGQGGHSALPHMGVDTITVGTQIITALQSIVSRKLNPAMNGVVSVTKFESDGNENILRAADGAGVNTLPTGTGTILTTATAVTVAQGGTGATNKSGAQQALDIDHLITLSGVDAEANHLGEFTGSTINDNQTIKEGIQALETAVEARAPINNPDFTGNPTAPTQAAGNDSTRIATTEFVTAAVAALDAAALRNLLGIVSAANDAAAAGATPSVQVGQLYFNTGSNAYVLRAT